MVRPGFAFVRGVLEVTLEIRDAIESSVVRYVQYSKGIGTSSEVETTVELSPQDQGTKIRWRAEVTKLGGLLKAVPSGLIRGAAQKVIEDLWLGIEKLALAPGKDSKDPVR
jgi:carbon monoxide dehydrogenase subunit G